MQKFKDRAELANLSNGMYRVEDQSHPDYMDPYEDQSNYTIRGKA